MLIVIFYQFIGRVGMFISFQRALFEYYWKTNAVSTLFVKNK